MRKPKHERAVRTTMTFPPRVWDKGRDRMKELGYPDFASYVHELIRIDAGMNIKITVAPKESAAA